AWEFTKYLNDPNSALKFLQGPLSFVSFGKARLAYGESGQEPGAYQTLATYATTAFGDGGWGPSITPTQAGFGGLATGPRKPQDNLKPERTKELTGGVDLGLFKDRADAHFTYYHDRTIDVIFLAPLPVTTGYSQQVQNAANILNVGYEVSLNVRPVVTGDVTWEIAGQWATNDNRVTDLSGAKFVDLPGALAGAPGAAVLGSRVGVLRGNDFARCGITSGDSVVFGQSYLPGPVGGPGAGTKVQIGQAWFTGLGSGFGPVASQFIEDGGFVKLREISVGYSLNGEWVDRLFGLSSIDLRVAGRNLKTWTKYTGIDPETNLAGAEVGLRGVDYFNNPQTRSFAFTVTLNR